MLFTAYNEIHKNSSESEYEEVAPRLGMELMYWISGSGRDDITPCIPVEVHQRFERASYFHY